MKRQSLLANVVHPFTSPGVGRATALIAMLIACHGCSPKGGMPTAPVSGTVTYQGNPVTSGTVMFVPQTGKAATGNIGPDGHYTLTTYDEGDGAVLGTHRVEIGRAHV